MKTGIELISEERQRQISEEGYTLEHDLMYDDPRDMIMAACIYANLGITEENDHEFLHQMADVWPWDLKYFKPKDQRRNLIRAGALIAAALDRLGEE
jgi:hypothetical protein